MSDFKSDAIELAQAVLDNAISYDDGDYGPGGDYCIFCGKYKNEHRRDPMEVLPEIQHLIGCPVFVAQDVLTNGG